MRGDSDVTSPTSLEYNPSMDGNCILGSPDTQVSTSYQFVQYITSGVQVPFLYNLVYIRITSE